MGNATVTRERDFRACCIRDNECLCQSLPVAPPKNRIAVRLPAALVDQLSETAQTRSTSLVTLFYSWVLDAARLAEAGHGELLPRAVKLPRGAGEKGRVIRWSQDQDEFERFRSLIEAAGSSVPAVLRSAAQAYIASGGDALGMAWPPKSAALAA